MVYLCWEVRVIVIMVMNILMQVHNSIFQYKTRNAGYNYFRFGVDWGGTLKQITITPGSDTVVTAGNEYTLNPNNTNSGAMVINAPNTTDNYVLKLMMLVRIPLENLFSSRLMAL